MSSQYWCGFQPVDRLRGYPHWTIIIQMHYGVTEHDFYTVMFGVGRALGVCANIIWDRALLYPIERPKSLTTAMLEEIAGIK